MKDYTKKYKKYKKKYMNMSGGNYYYDNINGALIFIANDNKIDNEFSNHSIIETYKCVTDNKSDINLKYECNKITHKCNSTDKPHTKYCYIDKSNDKELIPKIFNFSNRKFNNIGSTCYINACFACLSGNIDYLTQLLGIYDYDYCYYDEKKKTPDENITNKRKLLNNIFWSIINNNGNFEKYLTEFMDINDIDCNVQNDPSELFYLLKYECEIYGKYYEKNKVIQNINVKYIKKKDDTIDLKDKIDGVDIIQKIPDIVRLSYNQIENKPIDEIIKNNYGDVDVQFVYNIENNNGEYKLISQYLFDDINKDDENIDKIPEKNKYVGLKKFSYEFSKFLDIYIVPYTYPDKTKKTYEITINETMEFKGKTYYLYAAAIHIGKTIDSGHYYAYIKQPETEYGGKKWYKVNDNINNEVNFNDIKEDISQNVVLLFYIEGQKHSFTYNEKIYKYEY